MKTENNELLVAVPKEFLTKDGHIMTHSHTIEIYDLKDIDTRLSNLEDLGMRGLLEPVGVLYYKGSNKFAPYLLHIFSYTKVMDTEKSILMADNTEVKDYV